MSKEERAVLLGSCVRHDKKLNTRSPLMNEVFCDRDIDYRMMGLGVIKVQRTTPRIQYMYNAVAGPEEKLNELGIPLGIIGKPRTAFDTMLRPVPTAGDGKSKLLLWRRRSCMKTYLLHSVAIISDLPPVAVETIQMPTKAPTGAIEFRDDVDLIEQDAKDIAIHSSTKHTQPHTDKPATSSDDRAIYKGVDFLLSVLLTSDK
ncbi:hypothetical protein MSG28_001598 [Choristoneura fumiferana]|uniref:Uncharacterized protein n=1 Tax=Choristoneura fumiferana TaxID=7141 RepID=A0ACC0KUS7_CHOFU|nr:hypothetical protein MSG28_001598 [Choristoneura fumiferana]